MLSDEAERDLSSAVRHLEAVPGPPKKWPGRGVQNIIRARMPQNPHNPWHRRSVDPVQTTQDSSIGGRSRLSVTEDANPPVARGNDRQHVPKWQTSGGLPAAAPP